MTDDLIRFLLDDDPGSRERRDAWIRSVTPNEASALMRWEAVENQIERRVAEALPDRELAVLYALSVSGRGELLDDRERERLAAAGPSLESARARLDAFDPLIESIAADCSAFEQAWDEHLVAHRTLEPTIGGAPEPAAGRVLVPADRPAFDLRSAPDRRPARPATLRRFAVRWLTAAVITGFAISVALLAGRDPDRISIMAGDSARIETLADGSVVRLYPGAVLSFEPDAARRVVLTGRAYFDVIHDESPFTVTTDHATIAVLGTAFGVTTIPAETEVVLVSGRVAASSNSHPDQFVVLEPGDRTVVRAGEPATAPMAIDVETSLEWTGLLIFRGTPLERVAGRLESVYGVDILLDEALAEQTITGTFRPEQPVEQIVGALAETLGATATADEDGTWSLRL